MIGDVYIHEKWQAFVEWLLDGEKAMLNSTTRVPCPLCGDHWEVERQEDLCWCQFFKREPV
jgi:hypothetical protein